MKRSDETLTAADMTPAEQAAWKMAVGRGLNISRADLRALLNAANTVPGVDGTRKKEGR